MTAFARAGSTGISWEIRSVNHRYLDAGFKMPDDMRGLEPDLRDYLRSRLHRGKVDCTLRINAISAEQESLSLDPGRLKQLQRLIDQLIEVAPNSAAVNPLEMLKWPGILKEEPSEQSELLTTTQRVFREAIDALVAMREREGAALQQLILERLDAVSAIVSSVQAVAPTILENQQQKLRARIAELCAEVDESSLEQELVYLAQKSDIAEEMDRLVAHVEEVRKTLKGQGAIGRRLDFLMQELNREANTLSSKASTAGVSIQAVDLKVIIEQMREQIQNIE